RERPPRPRPEPHLPQSGLLDRCSVVSRVGGRDEPASDGAHSQPPAAPPPLVADPPSDGGPVRPASAKATAVRRSFCEGGSAAGAKAGSPKFSGGHRNGARRRAPAGPQGRPLRA